MIGLTSTARSDELIAPVVEKLVLIYLRPDIRRRLRGIDRGGVKKRDAVALYVCAVNAAEYDIRHILGAGIYNGVKHKAQYCHGYEP